jgi:hypothetical protein
MFSFTTIARQLGLRTFKEASPQLHTEIVIAFESSTVGDSRRSIRSVDFMRGWYSTWITGPDTKGCGMHAEQVLRVAPGVDRAWSHQVVLLHDRSYIFDNSLVPGVVPESEFERAAWWASVDMPVSDEDNGGTETTMAEYLGLSRGSCITRLKHDGLFYPR